jgi:hypothetical protein
VAPDAPRALAEVEEDTEEAFAERRYLIKLLVERIDSGRDENGRATVQITYRFGPPSEPSSRIILLLVN